MVFSSVNINKVVFYSKFSNKKISEKSKKNLKSNQTKCFSKKSQSRLLNKVEAFLSAYRKWEILFITLTLPSKQQHDDIFLKTKVLNRFFIYLKREINKDEINYICKFEKQKNENIHFHFLTDIKICYKIIKKVWNKTLNEFGYIENYRKKMQNLSYKEYEKMRLRDEKKYYNKNLEISDIKKAFHRGVLENWSNPNTTDVKKLKNIKSVALYISKYMKKEKGDILKGRYWSMSKKVEKLQKLEVVVINKYGEKNEKFFTAVYEQIKNEEKQIFKFDYCTVFLINIFCSSYLKNIYCNYGKKNRKILKYAG